MIIYTVYHIFISFNLSPIAGHFLLTHLLMPKLKAAKQGRVINVSAQAHIAAEIHLDDLNLENNYSALEAFGQSKLAMILMARHMGRILKGKKIIDSLIKILPDHIFAFQTRM